MPERFPTQPEELEFDVSHAHSARIYNYWLGGKDNFAADREAAEQAIAANPGIVADVRANRAFLVRVVRYLASGCGVRQFLDIGTGLPTASNTHEAAQAVARKRGSSTQTMTRWCWYMPGPCSRAPAKARQRTSMPICAIPRPSCGQRRRRWTSASRSRCCC